MPPQARSWQGAESIETVSAHAYAPQIAMDANGNAIAVWAQDDGPTMSIYANRYVAGTGWQEAQLIEDGTGEARYPQIAMNASGNAIAVWEQYDGSAWSIYANVYR